MSKFNLGQLLATPGALAALEESGQRPIEFICRHAQGDWGQVCAEDGQLNDGVLSASVHEVFLGGGYRWLSRQ
jgi:hypothetical protein